MRQIGRRPAATDAPTSQVIGIPGGPIIKSAAGQVQAVAQQQRVALGTGITQAPTGTVVQASPASLVFRTPLDPQAEQREFRTQLTGVLG